MNSVIGNSTLFPETKEIMLIFLSSYIQNFINVTLNI